MGSCWERTRFDKGEAWIGKPDAASGRKNFWQHPGESEGCGVSRDKQDSLETGSLFLSWAVSSVPWVAHIAVVSQWRNILEPKWIPVWMVVMSSLTFSFTKHVQSWSKTSCPFTPVYGGCPRPGRQCRTFQSSPSGFRGVGMLGLVRISLSKIMVSFPILENEKEPVGFVIHPSWHLPKVNYQE